MTIKLCAKCVLPETFPGTKFNENGICNHCAGFSGQEALEAHKRTYEKKFIELIDKYRGKGAYDCLMAYSGGKDSTYTLLVLKKRYGLNVLALTVDNGFISESAFRNMTETTGTLGVDHMVFRPRFDLMKKIFLVAAEQDIFSKKTLERASTICTSCIGIVKSFTLKTALEKGIMLIGYGWSPGQAPVQSSVIRTNPALMASTQAAIRNPLSQAVGNEVDGYFLNKDELSGPERFPYNVHPLAFLEYNEEKIIKEIGSLGWKTPKDTDANSTNCLLNAYANDVHIKKFNFHPYVWEIANMVRSGVMSRQEGHEKIYGEQSDELLKEAKRRLGIV